MTATILVIDDSEDDQRLYQRALRSVDCSLSMASSAQAGLVCMADLKPDAILLDYNLPDMDGLSLIKMLAGRSGLPSPVIMLTGEGSESVAVEAMKSGADDYLVKDTAGQYLRLLPGVVERAMTSHMQREQNRLLLDETTRLMHRNRMLMQHSADGIHVMDMRGNIVEANDAFCRMLGYTMEEMTRLNVTDWDAQYPAEELQRQFNALADASANFETVHRRKDGSLIDVEISASGIKSDGRYFVFAASRDITARKRAIEVLQQRTRELNESQRLAHIGDWYWDAKTDENTVSEELCRIYGRETIPPFAEQRGTMYSHEIWQQLNAAVQDAVRTGIGYDLELPALRMDGTPIWINTRCEAVHNSKGEIVGLHGTVHDITGRKQAEQALREVDRHKDEFLAMLAHELRNPLVPIRNAAHVIGLIGLAEPRVKWAQEIIERQVAHLTRMVEDLLDVSRIARGKILLKRETIEFAELAEGVIQSARMLAESKGHRLTVRLPEQAVQLEGDPVRLSQLLLNLLDNAVKYTPDGGQIEFAARMCGPEIEISVRDNGMGIAPELLPRVFDLFRQDERKLDRAQGGLGIGLTLVRHLAGMHGGRVEVHSAGAGQGSTFTVLLPAAAMPALSAKPEHVSRSHPAAGMRVLVVEDDQAVADSTAVLLEMEGHQARIAESGLAALEQIAEFRPQVVLLDIGLKGMDGFETAQRLRQLPEGRNLCLVAVTGYAENTIRAQALASGCDYFLVKPVTFKDLSNLLDKVAVASI